MASRTDPTSPLTLPPSQWIIDTQDSNGGVSLGSLNSYITQQLAVESHTNDNYDEDDTMAYVEESGDKAEFMNAGNSGNSSSADFTSHPIVTPTKEEIEAVICLISFKSNEECTQ